jgi:general stress protein 26
VADAEQDKGRNTLEDNVDGRLSMGKQVESKDGFVLAGSLDHGDADRSGVDVRELEAAMKALFSQQSLAVLATQSSGAPYGNLVAFVATENAGNLLFATSRSTRKYDNIVADSRVAVVIDNRENSVDDFSEAMAVTGLGKAIEVKEPERTGLLEMYVRKHPHLKGFASSPSCALFKVVVEKYVIVYRFQNVVELSPNR